MSDTATVTNRTASSILVDAGEVYGITLINPGQSASISFSLSGGVDVTRVPAPSLHLGEDIIGSGAFDITEREPALVGVQIGG